MEEAKAFVELRRSLGDAPPTFFDTTESGEQIDMWPRVYAVCGGNFGLLERGAGHSNDLRSWKKGLDWISSDIEGAVKRGFGPGVGAYTGRYGLKNPSAWTKEDYKTVLREISLAKDHKHAVSFEKLQGIMGKKALLSMVEWNLVTVRRKCSWAKDLPEALFTELGDEKLVTMPSAVELYFALKMYNAGKLDAAPGGE
jgi:hypothetical protein